jgi:hypothetical protein
MSKAMLYFLCLKTAFKIRNALNYEIINQFKIFQVRLKSEFRKKIKKKIENIAYIFTKNNLNDLDV